MNQHRDTETEMALLGALLADPRTWDRVAHALRPAIFADAQCRMTAEAAIELYVARKAVDPVTVAGRLKEKNLLGSAVPEDFTHVLAETTGETTSAATYLERLQGLAASRALHAEARRMLADEAGTPQDRVRRATENLLAIETGDGEKPQKLSELLFRREAEMRAGGGTQGWIESTGFPKLDRAMGGFRPGVLSVWAARPGVGKSGLAVAFADNLGRRGIGVGVFWLEDNAGDFANRIIQRRAGIPSDVMRDQRLAKPHHADTVGRLARDSDDPVYVVDRHGLTVDDIACHMRRMHHDYGCSVFITDHLGEVRDAEKFGDRFDLAIGRRVRVFRDTAKALNSAPVLFVQMNRKVEDRAEGRPRLSDLEGSGQIEQAARFVAFMSRPRKGQVDDDTLVVDVAKNTLGTVGDAELTYKPDLMAVYP